MGEMRRFREAEETGVTRSTSRKHNTRETHTRSSSCRLRKQSDDDIREDQRSYIEEGE